MPDVRQRLQAAAITFADSIYEILRDELLTEVRAQLKASLGLGPPTLPASRAKAATAADEPPSSGTVIERVVAHVGERGAVRPKDIAIGVSKTALYRALAAACEAGLLIKVGEPPLVRYEVAGAAAPPRPAAPRDAASTGSKGDRLIARVAAYVRENPNADSRAIQAALGLSATTNFRALAAAVERGVLQRLGEKRNLRYVVAGGVAPAPATQASAKATGAKITGEELVARVIAFVRANPECRHKQLVEATGAGEHALHVALRAARARGAVRLEGVKIKTRYFPVTAKSETLPPPPRARTIPPPPPIAPPPAKEQLTPSSGPHARAEALFHELDAAVDEDMHEIRFGALLQAIVAEIRMIRPGIPDDHPLARRLDGTIRRVTAIRAERLLPFVLGLKRDAKADWYAVAKEARKRIATFDKDAEVGVAKKKTHRPPPRAQAAQRGANDATSGEPLPKLAAVAAERPVVLVGGIKKNEVLEHVHDHHGLRVEWAAMQGANARAAEHLLGRIRNGHIGAVVVLEGLTGTTQVRSVVEACKAAGVPFAYGDRAGTASLRGALLELEGARGG